MDLTEEQLREARRQFASLGGEARKKKLSKEQRKQISQKALEARWGKKVRENEPV